MNINTEDPRFQQILTNALIGHTVTVETQENGQAVTQQQSGLLILGDEDGVHLRVDSLTKIIPYDYIVTIYDKGLAR